MRILTDTREKLPYQFKNYPVKTETAALAAGDYSLAGFQGKIGIKRTSLAELASSLMDCGRENFEKELMRGECYEIFTVIIEADIQDVSAWRYDLSLPPASVLQTITKFYIKYKIPFLFCGSREGGEYMVHLILRKYFYEIEKRFKVLKKRFEGAGVGASE